MSSTSESRSSRNKMDIIAKEKYSTTFLSILDDKNKMISLLKQQLDNQKLQILYYLKRELKYSKITELSETCRTENTEDLPVMLALAQFGRKNGIKSNLLRLYEYMEHVDAKLNRNLTCQEFILRKIVEKICRVVKSPDEHQVTCKQTANQNVCLDLFNALLEATVGLRKKLDCFRICCNRLIIIEDERNSIAEQVISLPVEQRLHCNFLITVKQERMELEKKLKKIKDYEKEKKKDMNELNYLEDNSSGLQNRIKSSIREIGDFSTIGDAVDYLKLEAKSLINASEKRKKRSQLQQTEIMINLIKLAANGGELYTDNKYQQIMFEAVKKEIHNSQTRLTNELHLTRTELECTRGNLKTVLQERNELKLIKNQFQSRMKKIEKTHATEMAALKQQRDKYKNQVEDLEIVREAYTQLLIKPNSESSHKENEMTKTIKHLERKLCLMSELIKKQNNNIILQNDFIENLKTFYKEKETSDPEKESREYKEDNEENYLVEDLEKTNSFSKIKLNQKTPLTLPVSSGNKKMVKEIIQNVLKDIRSKKKTNLSSFSLEIKCSCKEGSKQKNCPCNELELMRDCSHESIPVFCTPLNKKNENPTTNLKSKNKYSRNIEVLVQNNKLHSSSDDYSFSAF